MKVLRSLLAAGSACVLAGAAFAQQKDAPKFELPQVGSGAPAPAAPAVPAPAPAPAAPAVTYTEAQMMEVYGYMLGARMSLAELEFTQANVDAMAKGLSLALQGKQPAYDAQQIGPQLQELLKKRQDALLVKVRNANLAAAAGFFTQLEKENKNVKQFPSGLRYEIVTEGKGAVAKAGQVAKIHLVGAFINGQIFENTRAAPEGQTAEPVEIFVQEGANIPGIVEALTKMPVGSKWRLFVPPHLAFGDDGAPQVGIPPAATLLFELEVFSVADAPKAPEGAKK